jgi:hypothetical protein
MDLEYELVTLLRAFPPDEASERRLRALIDESAAAGRLPARVATRLYARGDNDAALGAFSLLQTIGDLAIEPLLEGPHPTDPARVGQSLELLAHAELELRARVLRRIDSLLDDKRRVPPPEQLGPVEETPDERRVCDVAYVAMRSLVHFGESAWDRLSGARAFYRSAEGARDGAIVEARRTNDWRRALRGPDAADEEEPA